MTSAAFRPFSPVFTGTGSGGPDLLGLRMSAEDYLAIGETPERYELVEGVVLMSPSPRPRHFKVVHELLKQLDRFEDSGGVVDVYSDIDLRVGDSAVYRPDLCVYDTQPAGGTREWLDTAPNLVVEVLSPGSQALDLVTKREGYERLGVAEYWVIDPATARVRCWRMQGGRLVEIAVDGEALPSGAIKGFVLDLLRVRKLLGDGRAS